MSCRLLLAFLCIASISTGCVVKDSPPTPQPGSVTFLWTFSGLRCDQARDVAGVNITIPGESLANNGRFACNTAGADGITLHDFAPGSYSFSLQAVNFQNQILFEANGSFTINGSQTVTVDLTPTGSPGSYAYLNWTFPGNASCAQAGVASVDVLLDNLAPHNVPCTEGQASPGLQTPFLAPGQHSIEFIARAASGQPLYSFKGGLTTRAYDPVSASYSLVSLLPPPPQPGDMTFLWTFGGRRCDQARDVTGVNITIPGESLANNGRFACNTSGVDGITLRDFAPGSYSFTLQAVNLQNQVLFEANGSFTINGDRTLLVDLTPTGSPGSYAYLNWTFPGNASCAQAGVASVDVLLNNLAPHNVPCTQGQASPGVQTPYLAPGQHSIELIARSASGQVLYSFKGGLTTQAYNPVFANYTLAPPPPQPGDVTFLWTFGGRQCSQARDVTGVIITIPGEPLANNGRFPCNTSGTDGIALHDFAPGSYTFKIQGVDVQNQVLFEATGSFTINGDRLVRVDLSPVGPAPSYAYLSWTFPGSQSCAQAGVATVDITLGQSSASFSCGAGQTSPGVRTPSLTPGEHSIEFIARDASGRPLYYFNGTLMTQAYNTVAATYSLYAVGGAAISWRFSDGSTTFDCNTLDPTGNLQVGINFQDTVTGEWVYGAAGDWHGCTEKPIVYSFLRPGTYKVSLYTRTSTNVEYRSNPSIPPIQVQAHVFPGPGSALEVMMYRQ